MALSEYDDDHAAFSAFVAARSSALLRTAYLLTGDAHLAEDLVQTALFLTARSWHRIEGDAEPYVRRILYTQSVSRWRRRRVQESPLEYARDQASAAPVDQDLRLTLEEALRRLTTKQRAILVLRYFEDLTEVETARVLGIGVGTVKSSTRQALGRLRVLAPELSDLIASHP